MIGFPKKVCSKLSKAVCLTILGIAVPFNAYAFSIDFASGTPVVDAVRALGYRAGKNVVINGELKGTLAMHLDDTDFDTALEAMSIAGNFSYDYFGDMVLIAPSDALKTYETFKLQHIEPETIAKQLGVVTGDGGIVYDNEAHTIVVKGSRSVLKRAREAIEELDVAQKQVNIKATVIELSKSKAREMGLSYMSDVWTKNTAVGGYNGFQFSVQGAHQETLGTGNVLARPNLTVFDGRKASLLMGDKVPVFTSTSDSTESDSDTSLSVEYKEVGVKLEVIPRINEEDKETITMVIKPSVSTISQWVESGNNKAPQISERSVETTVRVKSGETILIGGLLKEEEVKNIKAIPFLSKLPFLGELFKTRSIDKKNSEIVLAITPTIIYDENGVPQVQMQETTPKLHRKLMELQGEKQELNIDTKAQGAYDIRNKELEERNAEVEKMLKEKELEIEALKEKRKLDVADASKSRDAEIETLRRDKEALEKELRASNASIQNLLDSLNGAKKRVNKEE